MALMSPQIGCARDWIYVVDVADLILLAASFGRPPLTVCEAFVFWVGCSFSEFSVVGFPDVDASGLSEGLWL
ncbi:hypothetical protein U1Q18_002303 [Sarracenia purpurea var. burkii]